jgi:hypothetical protein
MSNRWNRLAPLTRATLAVLFAGQAALITLGATAAADVTAATSGTTAGGVIHLLEVGGASGVDSDVFTGAITDHGVDHLGVVDHGNVNKIVLSKGSFEANISKLNKNTAPTSMDSTNCSVVLAGAAPTMLSDGTGAYKGITGTLAVAVHEAEIVPRLSNGKCNFNEGATPVAQVISVAASGRVSFK